MSEPSNEQLRPPNLRGYFLRALRQKRPHRPLGLFLLFAMLAVLVLGVQFLDVRANPQRFAFLLSVYFIFFLVVIARAVVDVFDLVRESFRAREGLLHETFAKDGFAEELGRRVEKGDRGSWPEL